MKILSALVASVAMSSQGAAALFDIKENQNEGIKLPIFDRQDQQEDIKSIGQQLDYLLAKLRPEGEKDRIDIQDYEDWSYYVEVEIGTPPQKFNLSLQTGEANTYVYSKDCWSLPCFFYPLYDKTKSSSYVELPYKYTRTIMSIVGGMFQGTIMVEKMKLGDVVVDQYPIGLVSGVSGNDFVSNRVSGVLGLSYNSTLSSPFAYPSFLEAANVTSYSIYDRTGDKPSYLHLNTMDTDNFEPIRTHDIINTTWINLNLTHMSVEDMTVKTEGIYATFASGFKGIAGPKELLDDLLGPIAVAKDCSNLDDLPSFTFGIDSFNYTLEPRDYVSNFKSGCSSPFLSFNSPPPINQHIFIGDAFFKKFPLHVDLKNDQVTFQREKLHIQHFKSNDQYLI